jgi:biopolymer transport protein ExbB
MLRSFCLIAALLAAGAAVAADPVGEAIDATVQSNRDAKASQQKINQLDDQTRAALEKYRAALVQTQQLTAYAQQMEKLAQAQDIERASLEKQLTQVDSAAREILPLLTRMVESLEKFVSLDLPFLRQERNDRVTAIRKVMDDPSTSLAEKYRRVLEAYQIEAEYGRTLGAERGQVDDRQADLLRVGRAGLFYLTLDGDEAGRWDAQAGKWETLPGKYRREIRHGLKIARETAAPDFITLPMPVAGAPDKGQAGLGTREWLFASLRGIGAGVVAALIPSADAAGIDELLKQVREGAQANARLNAEREQRFLRERDQQAQMLKEAEGELAGAQARGDRVKARYEAGQKTLAELKARLSAKTGEDAQVYAAARQAAADFRAATVNSFVTAQLPGRIPFLEKLAGGDALPTVKELEDLWFILQEDMTESGKTVRFRSEIFNAEGGREQAEVIRVGAFSAFTGGRYLSVQSDGKLLALPRQPAGKFKSDAKDFADETSGVAPILIDPTHGTLLAQEAERPNIMDRIEQGGVVGYVIIAVGVVGALLAVWQLFYLTMVGRRVNEQLLQLERPSSDNPLGRVLSTFKGDAQTAQDDAEVVELRLSEAVLREVPRLERFQAFLRLAVAAGPLLGLIGTVAGMIVTFQVITEAGAGDPKLMAGGISQAMIATLLGLGIAIPLLFINALLAARSRAIIQVLDEQSTGLLAQRLETQRRA